MQFVKKNLEIIVILIVLAIMMTLAYIDRQELVSLDEQQTALILQQEELLKRSEALDVKIDGLRKEFEILDIPIINPKFIEWWENEENK